MRLTVEDQKDLETYIQGFAVRVAQVVVQSRLGVKISTACKPPHHGAAEWQKFNLNVADIPCVMKEANNALSTITPTMPFCTEMSLTTTERTQSEEPNIPIEIWRVSMAPEQCDTSNRTISMVLNRMSILMKSLVSCTRATPIYNMSRCQSDDSYIFHYDTYMGMKDLSRLGKDYKSVKIGQICTPIGTLQLSWFYRVDMNEGVAKKNSIMVKSDHFNSNSSLRKSRNSDLNDLSKPMRPGPFADPKPKLPVEPQLPDVTRLLAMGKLKQRSMIKSEEETESFHRDESWDEQKENKCQNTPPPSPIPLSSLKSEIADEYWMKELPAPFATRGPTSELMQFYRQCRKSPPLQSPQSSLTSEEITNMISMFESQLPEYEALVQSFCGSPEN